MELIDKLRQMNGNGTRADTHYAVTFERMEKLWQVVRIQCVGKSDDGLHYTVKVVASDDDPNDAVIDAYYEWRSNGQ